MKALIVYYSRTGRTKKIAKEIQLGIKAEIEEIKDSKNRKGILGWLSAGRDAGARV
jgi:flavodoxin